MWKLRTSLQHEVTLQQPYTQRAYQLNPNHLNLLIMKVCTTPGDLFVKSASTSVIFMYQTHASHIYTPNWPTLPLEPPSHWLAGSSLVCAVPKNIIQTMSIAMWLSVTATLGNCRMLFICDYVFSEHKRLDNVNRVSLKLKICQTEDKLADMGSNCNKLQIKQSYRKWFGIRIATKILIIEFMLHLNEGRQISLPV